MMTNSEVIEQLKFLKKVDYHIDTKEACNISINIIKENENLRSENDNLKSEVNHYKDLIEHRKEVSIINYNLYSDLECERDELLVEVEELKATISKMETITEKVFEEIISRWHDSDVEKVYEYLGITEDEYKWWLEGGYQ